MTGPTLSRQQSIFDVPGVFRYLKIHRTVNTMIFLEMLVSSLLIFAIAFLCTQRRIFLALVISIVPAIVNLGVVFCILLAQFFQSQRLTKPYQIWKPIHMILDTITIIAAWSLVITLETGAIGTQSDGLALSKSELEQTKQILIGLTMGLILYIAFEACSLYVIYQARKFWGLSFKREELEANRTLRDRAFCCCGFYTIDPNPPFETEREENRAVPLLLDASNCEKQVWETWFCYDRGRIICLLVLDSVYCFGLLCSGIVIWIKIHFFAVGLVAGGILHGIGLIWLVLSYMWSNYKTLLLYILFLILRAIICITILLVLWTVLQSKVRYLVEFGEVQTKAPPIQTGIEPTKEVNETETFDLRILPEVREKLVKASTVRPPYSIRILDVGVDANSDEDNNPPKDITVLLIISIVYAALLLVDIFNAYYLFRLAIKWKEGRKNDTSHGSAMEMTVSNGRANGSVVREDYSATQIDNPDNVDNPS